jgi:ribosomal protein S18 acetylase RimI-like enzyme
MTTGSAVRIRRLRHGEEELVATLLAGDPVANVYLRSELRAGIGAGEWWAVGDADSLQAVALAGALAVPCIPDDRDAPALAEALASAVTPRIIVGPRDASMALHAAVGRPARDVRDHQALLALRRGSLAAPPAPIRRGCRADIDALVVAAAAMHHEEMGVDPMSVDSAWWRTRMTSLVDQGWSWVWMLDGEVVFKAELSAWTPDVVQLQGVYTAPAYRGQGVATRGVAGVCRALFDDVEVCSLYANQHNVAALGLYQRLGFSRHGEYATVIY